MNEVAVSEKLVTTKELAETLGVTPQTIRDTVEKLGLAKSILQVKVRGQSSFAFNEAQATAIKIELQNHSKVAQNGFNTLSISNDLEAWELQKRLDAYKDRRIAELTAENKKQKAVIDRIEKAGGCFSIAQTAKALKLPYGRNTLFGRLKDMKLLSAYNEPYQEQINAGRFKVVSKVCNDNKNHIVPLVTGKGLVYLAKRLNTEIDPDVMPDEE